MSFVWVILVALIVLILPNWLESRRQTPDLSKVTGQMAELEMGRTHYRWMGPVRGPVIVAIHGLSTNSVVWNAMSKGLVGLGYRVLVYDLYGRGFSDAVKGRQNADFFVMQLEELLEDQGLHQDLTLLGYSMGGAIATAFAARNPDRMKRLVLLAASGIDVNEDPQHRFMRRWPVLGDWLHALREPLQMRRRLSAHEDEMRSVPDLFEGQERDLARKGYFPSLLSSRRGILADRQMVAHRGLGVDGIPVLAIWAEKDEVIPISSVGTLAQWNRTARQEVIEGAGHGMPYTHPDEVVESLRELLPRD
ncbi:MAG: alpha/beta hydrolase [Flavimaricola sp.]|nr:alpha/beta hydrolase [Flavimaricola sp.]